MSRGVWERCLSPSCPFGGCVSKSYAWVFVHDASVCSPQFSFEYAPRPLSELPPGALDGLTELPFQVQVRFTRRDGVKCVRCITSVQVRGMRSVCVRRCCHQS